MHRRMNTNTLFLSFLVFSKLVSKGGDLLHVFKRNRGGDGVVGSKHIAAALLHCGNDALHLGLYAVKVVPKLRVDATVKGELVAIKAFELEGIHACLDLQGVEHLNTGLYDIWDERLDKSAGVHLHNHTALVRPIRRLFVVRLRSEERRVGK